MKNTQIFQSGLVVMGDLPRWKVLKNTKNFHSGLIVMGDLPKMSEKDDMIGLEGERGLKSALERR